MRLKEETAVVTRASPVGRPIGHTAQWLTSYEATDNNVVVSTRPPEYTTTQGTLDNAGAISADGNSNVGGQVEAVLRTGRVIASRDQVAPLNVVLVPLGCSPGDGLLITGEAAVRPPPPSQGEEEEEEEGGGSSSGGEDSSSAASTCSTSSSSDSASLGGQRRQQRQRRAPRRPRPGILNPNYPGFQRYADRLQLATQDYEEEEEEEEEEELVEGEEGAETERQAVSRNINNMQTDNNDNNNNNNNGGEAMNQLDGVVKRFDKSLSPVESLNIPPAAVPVDCPLEAATGGGIDDGRWGQSKMADAHLSRTGDEMILVTTGDNYGRRRRPSTETGMCKRDKTEANRGIRSTVRVADTTTATPPLKAIAPAWAQQAALRRAAPESGKDGPRKTSPEVRGGFDVYNIETAMPTIDLDAIETHLRAAEERRRRNDREEIRRRLAMGPEADDGYATGRKPSLQSRLQSGMNLQICFMNETLSDGESPSGSDDSSPPLSSSLPSLPHPPPSQAHNSDPSPATALSHHTPPRTLSLKSNVLSARGGATSHSLPAGGVVGRWDILGSEGQPPYQPLMAKWDGEDFFGRQARLQAEARVALAQAKEMAHMQMEVERQRLKANSPITQMVRASLLKVGLVFPVDRRRVSRQMLTEMNVAQLQVIVNDLHTQIEVLNEDLVRLLMERDDLHMEQDSMLVDIEDLTRYLGAKEKALKESGRDPGSGGSGRGGDAGAIGSLPSLPLIFRHGGGNNKLNQSVRPRIGLLSRK
ncbi:uncharacterized protein Schip1 [Hetaerina americana]|uniref:uncharacterized protein Schip1 n=1 Tax=Hetaerina americana TaxID=62018 RepID=UPI003A7F4092